MAFDRQQQVYSESRGAAATMDEAINDIENLNARYDVLNLETPNFAAGLFGTTQEITANDLLGIFTSLSGLKTAAPSQWAAFHAALRKARS
jgi:hypothetical protein